MPIRLVANDRGFTMAEMLVACAIVGLVMSGMLAMLMTGQQSFLMGAGQVEAQQNVRVAFDLIAREVRQAGYDPTSSGFAAIVNTAGGGLPTITGFRIQNDLNGNCTTATIPACLADPGERVDYTIVGNNLRRQAQGIDAAPQVIISGLDFTGTAQPAFQYQDNAGGAPANEFAIVNVLLMLQTRPTTTTATLATKGLVRVRLSDTIRLRNR
jgi:prepilin-type N-terminal cleavage/methylation domain-containing protein